MNHEALPEDHTDPLLKFLHRAIRFAIRIAGCINGIGHVLEYCRRYLCSLQ
jgi:hypothetical protein